MKNSYVVTIGDRTHEVIVLDGLPISIDAAPLTADVKKIADGEYSLLIEGRSYVVHALSEESGQSAARGPSLSADLLGRTYELIVNARTYRVRVAGRRSKFLESIIGSSRAEHGITVVSAPMPGLVLKVEVEAGQEITAGQGLVILEAMKMENEIKAHARGKISAVHVQERRAVEKGEPLVSIIEL